MRLICNLLEVDADRQDRVSADGREGLSDRTDDHELKEVQAELLLQHDLLEVFVDHEVDHWVAHQDHVREHPLVEGKEALVLINLCHRLKYGLSLSSKGHPGVDKPDGVREDRVDDPRAQRDHGDV